MVWALTCSIFLLEATSRYVWVVLFLGLCDLGLLSTYYGCCGCVCCNTRLFCNDKTHASVVTAKFFPGFFFGGHLIPEGLNLSHLVKAQQRHNGNVKDFWSHQEDAMNHFTSINGQTSASRRVCIIFLQAWFLDESGTHSFEHTLPVGLPHIPTPCWWYASQATNSRMELHLYFSTVSHKGTTHFVIRKTDAPHNDSEHWYVTLSTFQTYSQHEVPIHPDIELCSITICSHKNDPFMQTLLWQNRPTS